MSLAGDTVYLPHSLEVLAALKAQAGETDEAHALYRQAEDVIDGMLLRVPGAYAESSVLSIMSDTYLGDFKLAAAKDDPGMAFRIIERARGRTVADMLTHHEADPPSKANTMAAKLVSVQLELLDTSDAGRRNTLLNTLEEDEEELGYLDALDPIAHREAAHSAELPAIQRSLQPDEAVLEYVLADPESFCLAFDRSGVDIVRIPASKQQLESILSRYLASIASGQPGHEDAQRLYSMLLAPVPESLRPQRLVIILYGSLSNLPFDALQDGDGHYVIDSHIVSYAPSATVLFFLRNRETTPAPDMAFLGVGDVPYDYEPKSTTKRGALMHFLSRGVYGLSGSHLYDLPDSRQELIDADQALGQPQRSVLLMGKDATESRFVSEPLGEFKIIHFAVHGLASQDFPEGSALILGRDPHAKDGGLLEVRGIAHLSLHAELVTLSACDTGTGKIEGEEGIASLVPAFLFAGARSVVGSLWTVDDSATAIQMKQFYSHLGQGDDTATALRQAKLDYMRMVGTRAPIYWAGFIMVGDGSRRISL
jgi:CHAT domain-containing protein